MNFDHDLSSMSMDEAKLWIYLHVDLFRADIMANHAGRPCNRSNLEEEDSFGESVTHAPASGGARPSPGMRDN